MPYRRSAFVLVLTLAACAQKPPDAGPAPAEAGSAATIASAAPVAEAGADGESDASNDAAAEAGPATSGDELTTTRFQSMIYEHPSFGSFHIGWFRAGAHIKVVEKVPQAQGMSPCPKSWWKVDPVGYVCEGSKDGVTADFTHPTVVAMSKYQAKRGEPLPYRYAMSNGAHLYARIPTEREQQATEKELDQHLKRVAADKVKNPDKWALAMPVEAAPPFLEGGAQAPNLYAWAPQGKVLRGGYAVQYTRLGLLAAFEQGGRQFYLTTEAFVVPADRLKTHKPSEMQGIELAPPGEEGAHLPVVFVRYGNPAQVWKLDAPAEDGGASKTAKLTDKKIPIRGHAEITDKPVMLQNGPFHEILHPESIFGADLEPGVKYLLRQGDGTRVDASKEKPEYVKNNEVWIEVRVGTQVLVLYEGMTPKFATLVSTGAGKKHETPLGQFRIYQKHVSTKMSAEEKPPEEEGEQPERAYRYDDVGYTQFIFEGIALHTAFWHDGFGLPRSHGCINLSPKDSAKVFEWTQPKVPQNWHGMSGGRAGVPFGSMVWVRY
jgi:lipoprotein-anchoring transpeptidase ErfK/SrfK